VEESERKVLILRTDPLAVAPRAASSGGTP
jgi:hypothetical protein